MIVSFHTAGHFALVLGAQQANSGCVDVERLFSFLKQAFKETQETFLGDYINRVVMRRYNHRSGH